MRFYCNTNAVEFLLYFYICWFCKRRKRFYPSDSVKNTVLRPSVGRPRRGILRGVSRRLRRGVHRYGAAGEKSADFMSVRLLSGRIFIDRAVARCYNNFNTQIYLIHAPSARRKNEQTAYCHKSRDVVADRSGCESCSRKSEKYSPASRPTCGTRGTVWSS